MEAIPHKIPISQNRTRFHIGYYARYVQAVTTDFTTIKNATDFSHYLSLVREEGYVGIVANNIQGYDTVKKKNSALEIFSQPRKKTWSNLYFAAVTERCYAASLNTIH